MDTSDLFPAQVSLGSRRKALMYAAINRAALDGAPRSRTPAKRWRLAAAAGVAAVSLTVVGILTTGDSVPAYAVSKPSPGEVKITLNKLSGIDGLNHAIRKLANDIVVVPAGPTCATQYPASVPGRTFAGVIAPQGTSTITIATTIPPGETLVVGAVEGKTTITFTNQIVSGSPPPCLWIPAEVSGS